MRQMKLVTRMAEAAGRGAALLLVVLVAACTPRPGPGALTPRDVPADPAQVHRVFVVTTRADRGGYGPDLSFTTRYGYYDVSVPPDAARQLRSGAAVPDPARDYFVTEVGQLDRAAFHRAIRAHSRTEAPGLFVHGYNTGHPEGVLRLAQLTASAGYKGAPILFSWPSEGSPLDYVGDRQGALFSRDPLAGLLADLTHHHRTPVMLFGHSMGGFLIVETMRSLGLAGRRDVLNDLDTVLASPDIDVSLFVRTMHQIGPLRRPVAVLAAPGDRALAIAATLSGGRDRLGALGIDDPRVSQVAGLGNVELIDISAIQAGDRLGHDRYIRLAKEYSRLQGADGPRTGLRGAGAYVLRSIDDALLAPVFDRIDIQ